MWYDEDDDGDEDDNVGGMISGLVLCSSLLPDY